MQLDFESIELSKLICDGRMLEAIEYTHEFFPQVLTDSSLSDAPNSLHFRLLCQHFIELIRQSRPDDALEFVEINLAPIANSLPHLAQLLQVLFYTC